MYNPLISIIVPVYKTEQFIERCIESVIAQLYTNWELILIDDGSPDSSGIICDQYASIYSNIYSYHQKNSGVSVARNHGLSVASGKWIYFLDSDDYLLPPELSELIAYSEQGSYEIVLGNKNSVTATHKLNENHTNTYENNIEKIRRACILSQSPWLCGALIQKKLFKDIQFPIGLLREDFFTMPKLYFKAKKACFVPISYYCYSKENPESVSNGMHLQRRIDFMYSGFIVWKNHENLSHQVGYLDVEDICKKNSIIEGIKFLLYSALSNKEYLDKINEVWEYIQKNPYRPLKIDKKFQQYCILHNWHTIFFLMGVLKILFFYLRTYFRKRCWRKYGTLRK